MIDLHLLAVDDLAATSGQTDSHLRAADVDGQDEFHARSTRTLMPANGRPGRSSAARRPSSTRLISYNTLSSASPATIPL